MQTATRPHLSTAHTPKAGLPLPPRPFAMPLPGPEFGLELDQDRGFVGMLRGFKESGGLGRGDEVADRFKAAGRDVSLLARWIVEREVISFEWRSELWLPWFQFDRVHLSVRPDVKKIAQELLSTFDGWHLAQWFIEPNCWLGDRRPVEVLAFDPSEVLHAARTDRFVAMG